MQIFLRPSAEILVWTSWTTQRFISERAFGKLVLSAREWNLEIRCEMVPTYLLVRWNWSLDITGASEDG